MNQQQIFLGGVYESDSAPYPMRDVAFDNDVVMYDVRWPNKVEWAMAKLRGTFTYYRLDRKYFESHSRALQREPLSELELKVHRPDLPFAFAQWTSLSWYEPWQESDGMINDSRLATSLHLDVPAIFIAPFGPKDSAKPPVLVQAENGKSFSEAELLLTAHKIQAPFIGHTRHTSGVGIYRAGIKNRLPSFYLWGARSRLEAPVQNAV